MDPQLKTDLQIVLDRAFKRGLEKGRAEGREEMAEELRVPVLTIAVIVLAAGISIGTFIQ